PASSCRRRFGGRPRRRRSLRWWTRWASGPCGSRAGLRRRWARSCAPRPRG
ncbi:unnamed protein product, partial [Effrenium voratum]